MGGHGNKLRTKGEFKSQVPHVMLHLNPGVARHYGSQVRTLDKLKNKVRRKGASTYYIEFYPSI